MAEAVWIYLAGQASAALVPQVMTDVYEATKDWARKRYAAKRERAASGKPRPETFVIYGPDGEVLKRWTIDHEGEREH